MSNIFELTGIVTEILPLLEGVGKNGRYCRQRIVVKYLAGRKYKLIAVTLWNDLIGRVKPGDQIRLLLSIESVPRDGHMLDRIAGYNLKVIENTNQ